MPRVLALVGVALGMMVTCASAAPAASPVAPPWWATGPPVNASSDEQYVWWLEVHDWPTEA